MGIDKDSKQSRSYHHGALRTALLDAAFVLLEESGPEDLSFREIARRVGVSRTAPYNHFNNKEDLLITLAINGLETLQNQLMASDKAHFTPGEMLRERFFSYIRFSTSNPQLYRLMFGVGAGGWQAIAEMHETAKISYETALTTLRRYFEPTGRDADKVIHVSAIATWSVCHGLSMLFIDGKLDKGLIDFESDQEVTNMVANWFLAGLDAGADDILRQNSEESDKA